MADRAALALEQERSPVLLERTDGRAIGGSEPALRLGQAIGRISNRLIASSEDGSQPPGEGIRAAEILRRDQPHLLLPYSEPGFEGMRAGRPRREVLDFPMRFGIHGAADLRRAAVEFAKHVGRGTGAVGGVLRHPFHIARANFVHHLRVDNRRLGDDGAVLVVAIRIALRRQVQELAAADARILLIRAHVVIAKRERVAVVQLVIETGPKLGSGVRNEERLLVAVRSESVAIEQRRIDDRVVLNIAALEIEEERRLFVQRTTEIPVHLPGEEVGLVRDVGIARVQRRVAVCEQRHAVIFVAARLGENLDASETDLAEFGGERVLVDADFADRDPWAACGRR